MQINFDMPESYSLQTRRFVVTQPILVYQAGPYQFGGNRGSRALTGVQVRAAQMAKHKNLPHFPPWVIIAASEQRQRPRPRSTTFP
ncbi:hypothetical protein CDAR_542511 [Caerostris darwini]|uniref:Uncharacterized protein n=1 Tax=Caerostris darwini TaxID=1538125 RepID=A0AAV4RUS0_9ARAC|nr:hypothetical protein CDAR_542511 [Caerostris darwini]